jgi:hypothetical protein
MGNSSTLKLKCYGKKYGVIFTHLKCRYRQTSASFRLE